MSINQEKFSNLNKARKATHKQISNAISQLLAYSEDAINQQCYMHVNPDSNGADDLLLVTTPDFAETAEQFNILAERLMDMQSLAAGEITDLDMQSKYSVDLVEFSKRLI